MCRPVPAVLGSLGEGGGGGGARWCEWGEFLQQFVPFSYTVILIESLDGIYSVWKGLNRIIRWVKGVKAVLD